MNDGTHTVLEVVLHQLDDGPHYAEWDMWVELVSDGETFTSTRISSGTAPTIEGAIDHALNAHREWNT